MTPAQLTETVARQAARIADLRIALHDIANGRHITMGEVDPATMRQIARDAVWSDNKVAS